MPGDAHFANVSLLLHFDGADGATTTTDSSASPKTATFLGGAALSTSKRKYGASALSGGGIGGERVSFPSSGDLNMGAGDFTVECWAYVEDYALSGRFTYFVQRREGTGYYTFCLNLTTDNKPEFSVCNTGLGLFHATGSSVLPKNQWVALRGVRDGASIKLFVDGALAATTAISGTAYGSAEPLLLIGASNADSRFTLNGYLDEVRITKGVARSTSSYTPDASAFPDSAIAYSLTGVVRDASNALASRKVAAYREDTNALVGATTSDGTTGAYSISVPVGAAHTLVFYPAEGESLNALSLRGVVPVEA